MRTQSIRRWPRKSGARLGAIFCAALLGFSACATAPSPPPALQKSQAGVQEGVPGGVFVNSVEKE